eukprot:scaffold240911_cov38-Prasinocladus_malaysianus.AAC.1
MTLRRYYPQAMLDAVVSRATSDLRLLKPGQQALLIHVLSSSAYHDEQKVLEEFKPRLLSAALRLNPQQLAFIAGPYLSIKDSAGGLLEAVAESTRLQLHTCRPENLSRILWALSQAKPPHAALFDDAVIHLIRKLPDVSAAAIGPAVWAYAHAGRMEPTLWEAIANHFFESTSTQLENQHLQELRRLLIDTAPHGIETDVDVAKIQHRLRSVPT